MSAATMIFRFRWTIYRKWASAAPLRSVGTNTTNRVQYLCLNSIKGYAIVQGSHAYTVEFEYQGGSISKLVCDCFCSYPCKHEFAAMLHLRETLDLIQKRYAEEYAQSGCFTVIYKETLFAFAVSGKEYVFTFTI